MANFNKTPSTTTVSHFEAINVRSAHHNEIKHVKMENVSKRIASHREEPN
jgi:hypothetical protein